MIINLQKDIKDDGTIKKIKLKTNNENQNKPLISKLDLMLELFCTI